MTLQNAIKMIRMPGDGLELVEELGLHHGDLVDDEVFAACPVLQDSGSLRELQTLLQRS